MSITIMSQVWAHSQHKGSELLLMLALADNANDQGVAYPSIATLARKTRLKERTVQYLLREKLEPSGELEISTGTGPRGCNEYIIHILGVQTFQGMKSSGAKTGGSGGAKAIAPEPNTEREKEEKPVSPSPDNGPSGPDVKVPPENLKRSGLSPGSSVWRMLAGEDTAGQNDCYENFRTQPGLSAVCPSKLPKPLNEFRKPDGVDDIAELTTFADLTALTTSTLRAFD